MTAGGAARELDLVVLGATGFTGRQAAATIARTAPAGLRWALAARDPERLQAVRASLGPAQADRPLLVVDSHDPAAVAAMVARTRVLLTTVGPYAAHGGEVFAACARVGTDYVDITGESAWVARIIAAHEATALASGARLVPFCGFDSVPSDLGAFMMADWIRRSWGQPTRQVDAVFRARGGLNGGTIASALGMFERGDMAGMDNPFLLNPPGPRPDPARSPDLRAPQDWDWIGGTVAPFVMAPVNTRVVRRSAALLAQRGQGYGPDFAWQEAMWAGRGLRGRLRGQLIAAGMGLAPRLGGQAWVRDLVRRLAPAPGEGPSEAAMDGGSWRVDLLAEAEDGRKVQGLIEGKGYSGNRGTVRMLCEAALCLALDGAALPTAGGVGTPASTLGQPYLERLRAAGIRFEVLPPAAA